MEDLKKLVPDRPARYDDVRLLRFLRARAFDVEKAKSLLEEDIISFFFSLNFFFSFNFKSLRLEKKRRNWWHKRNFLKWRKSQRILGLLSKSTAWFFKRWFACFFWKVFLHDFKKSFILIKKKKRFGVLDAKGIMASYPLRTLLRSHLYGMELREQA